MADQRMAELQALIALANGAPGDSGVFGHGFVNPYAAYVSISSFSVVPLPTKLQNFNLYIYIYIFNYFTIRW